MQWCCLQSCYWTHYRILILTWVPAAEQCGFVLPVASGAVWARRIYCGRSKPQGLLQATRVTFEFNVEQVVLVKVASVVERHRGTDARLVVVPAQVLVEFIESQRERINCIDHELYLALLFVSANKLVIPRLLKQHPLGNKA